jgi:sporulation protein YlmC with PRC-barrel domain
MIRKLLATTAIATLVAAGAYAQDTTQMQPAQPAPTTTQNPAVTQPETPMVIKAEGNLATNVIGKAVYNGTGDDAQKIGSVNDLVISPDGQIQALVIGVGGFLGIGQKDVAIEYDLAKWEERDNDRWIVVETTADALKAQQEFDRQAYEPMPADADVAETKPATAEDLAKAPAPEENADETASTEQQPAGGMAAAPTDESSDQAAATDEQSSTDQMAAAPADQSSDQAAATDEQSSTDQMAAAPADQSGSAESTDQQTAQAPASDENAASDDQQQTAQAPASDESASTDQTQTAAIDRSTLKEQATDQIRAEDFVGTTVYGANDENVGEIGDVILSEDGKVDAVLVDVGGFLGIGEKEVALGMDNLQFMTDENGKLYLYTNLSKEQLEAQQAYDESTYAQNRDQMRMNVPATE